MKVRKETAIVLAMSEALVLAMGALVVSRGLHYPGTAAAMGAAIVAVPYILERTALIKLPVFVQVWTMMAVGLHIFGLMQGHYDDTWWWDELTHLVSSSLVGMLAAIGLFLFDLHSVNIKVPRWGYPVMILIFSILMGVVWEMAEFAGDLLAGTRMQYSLIDTLSDCYVDMLGGLTASTIWVLWLWRDPFNEIRDTAQEALIERFRSVFIGLGAGR